jgi:hypothetical protein
MARIIPTHNPGARGVVHVCQVDVGFGDDADAISVVSGSGTPAPGDIITDVKALVTTLFNDSGTDLLNFGITGNPDFFVDDVDGSSTGFKTVEAVLPYKLATGETLLAQYDGENSDATTGRVSFFVTYIRPSA